MTYLNIHFDRLLHNLNFLKSKLSSKTKIIAVVKADAYGHGAIEISKVLEQNGITLIAVASGNEGKILRENGIKSNIIVFYPNVTEVSMMLNYSLEPAIYSKQILLCLIDELKTSSLNSFPLHLKFNTGLNRLGFNYNEIGWIKKTLDKTCLKIKSIYSHLSSSEEKKTSSLTNTQIKVFNKIKDQFKDINPKIKYHLLNSSGIFNYPHLQYDFIRTGISLYGYSNNKDWDKYLLPVADLTSKIIQIHNLKKGDSVGYNSSWIAKKKSRIAVIPLGHADGIGRYFGNSNACVWINNEKAKIVGNICMDMFMVDISKINCHEGDSVIVFDAKNSASKFSESAGTISYELLSSIGKRVNRKYL